jgi:tetratricopeptide (TPR) repeat protein
MSTSNAETAAENLPNWLQRHRWPMRIVLALLMPVLLLAGLELVLRVVGFGYNWHLFRPVPNHGVHGANATFGYRFFPQNIARKPVPGVFALEKGPRTFRIFVMGASAAAGIPNATYSFAQILDVMLEAQYPDFDFETVNTAVTAINSHVVLPIVEECTAYEPDLFIVYLGNNEVIGPFSAGSSLVRQKTGLRRIRATIGLRKTKIGQLIQSVENNLRDEDELLREWRGMTMFSKNFLASDDPALDIVAAQFRANLEDIVKAAARTATPIMLCTLAVNLRDSAPFISLHREDLGAAEQARWDELFVAANAELAAGRPEAAIPLYRRAAAIDDQYAVLHYQLGHALLGMDQTATATEHFLRARDLDGLRFRTDSRLNDVIRAVAREESGADLQLIDIAQLVADWSSARDSVQGEDLFFEHVHFNFAGNYLIARLLYDRVIDRLPEAIRASGPRQPEPPTPEQCATILALTEWNEYDMLAQVFMMVRENPFTGQIDHAERLAALEADLQRRRDASGTTPPEELIRIYRRALARRPADLLIRFNYAKLLGNLGQLDGAERELRYIDERQYDMGTIPPPKQDR